MGEPGGRWGHQLVAQANTTGRMSEAHALCVTCQWPCVRTMMEEGICHHCLTNPHLQDQVIAVRRAIARVYARCV